MQHPTLLKRDEAGDEDRGMPPVATPRRPCGRPLRALRGAVAFVLVVVAGGVSSSGSTGCGKFCNGGFVRVVGGAQTCEGLCEPAKCANPGNFCVDNRCELQCASHLDCASGQDCVPATTDGAHGAAITICQANGKSGIGALCPFGVECTTTMGDATGQQPTCPDGSSCDYTQCGGAACAPDPSACPEASKCSVGKCPDRSPCTVPGCQQSECKPLVCLTAGSGDASAYCTLQDCHGDSDCPGGYGCETVRDPHQICGEPMPSAGICGTTTDPCVDPSMNMTAGTTFAKGQFCTQRSECRVRRQCDPCATDLDCSLVPGMICPQVGSSTACTLICASDADCVDGFHCIGGACVPRFGACVGSGNFCEPCRDDSECGPGLLCIATETGGARACFQPNIACTTSAMCPKSPSGQRGVCLDETVNVASTSPDYHTCYLPFIAATQRFGCWPGNEGAACNGGADCASKSCKGADAANMQTGTCD